jgi:hypothetical protein
MVAQEGPPTLAGWIVSFDHRAARAFARAFDPDRHCPVCVRQPRVRDRAGADCERIRFSQNILPRYARRTKSFEALIPILYLKGVSKNPPSFRGGYLTWNARQYYFYRNACSAEKDHPITVFKNQST